MTLAATATMPTPQTFERLRVLLVDDTADVRFLLRRALEGDGRFEVVGEAADGDEGVKLATKFLPDVAVVDLAMPVMDGFQAIPLIRSQSPATKVVVLTAFRGSHMAAEAAGAGADAYIEKGSGFDGVVTTITDLYGPTPRARPAVYAPLASRGGDTDIDEILSKVNHELRTPVAVIQGFAVRIQQLAADPEPDLEFLARSAEAIERNANMLAALLQSVADARDLEAGRMELHPERVDLAKLVAELVGDLEVVSGDHSVALDLDEVEAWVDPVRVRQVVTNLLSNAAKFSADSEPIEVHLAGQNGMARLSVRDHGPGVPVGRESDVFGKFTRLAKGVKGTGLGLYISRGIAVAHGGELVLENSRTGCTFSLRLPLLAPR
jgi:signal transduction histidine kinase